MAKVQASAKRVIVRGKTDTNASRIGLAAHRALSLCPAAAKVCVSDELGFYRRSKAQLRSPIEMRGRLLELCRRARPRLPRAISPAQHTSPHLVQAPS